MSKFPNQRIKEVNDAFDPLILAIDLCLEEYYESIKLFASEKNNSEIATALQNTNKMIEIKGQIINCKDQWENTIARNSVSTISESNAQEDSDTDQDVIDRTSWKVANNSIRIETERVDGPSYSNTFPLKIFSEIAKSALDFAIRNGSVKTSDVLNVLKNTIISNSDYKKAPRIPVYATFKILVKEHKFKVDENNSHKYLLIVPENSFIQWIDTIK